MEINGGTLFHNNNVNELSKLIIKFKFKNFFKKTELGYKSLERFNFQKQNEYLNISKSLF